MARMTETMRPASWRLEKATGLPKSGDLSRLSIVRTVPAKEKAKSCRASSEGVSKLGWGAVH